MPRLSHKAAFTLIELVIAMTISVITAGMALAFLFEGLRSSLKTTAIYTNDMTQWGLTNRLMIDSKLATAVAIYTDNSAATMSAAAALTKPRGVAEGAFGNFLVLCQGNQQVNSTTVTYSSIYGYYYNPTAQTISRFQYTPTAAEASSPLEVIVSNELSQFSYVTLATNLALLPNSTQGAFLNRKDGAVANLLLRAAAGPTNLINSFTRNYRVIEVSFYTRQ
jgi:prepilin-type N-terminal cleavage/methylation domain-containing protein